MGSTPEISESQAEPTSPYPLPEEQSRAEPGGLLTWLHSAWDFIGRLFGSGRQTALAAALQQDDPTPTPTPDPSPPEPPEEIEYGYDAENRLVSVSAGEMQASILYDGDGQRVASVIAGEVTVYIGEVFEWEVTAASMRRYYYAGAQRVAVRLENTSPVWLLGDHLGSTSVAANTDGSLFSRQGYLPWGELRFAEGSLPGRYQFTGQASYEAEFGLYYFKARWYDPHLGRFSQPDSIVPDPGNSLDWDRYAYAQNNPIRFYDPTGHKACDGAGVTEDDCEVTQYDIIAAINLSFQWNVAGNWTKRELFILLDSGIAIENKLSTLMDGNGRGWMLPNLGGTNFHQGDLMQIVVMGIVNPFTKNGALGIVPFHTRDVYLTKAGINTNTITHELGHVLDISTGTSICPATWCGGGIADALIEFIGGAPSGIRWMNGANDVPEDYRWYSYTSGGGYGNNSTADYFAEAFTWMLFDPSAIPSTDILLWLPRSLLLIGN